MNKTTTPPLWRSVSWKTAVSVLGASVAAAFPLAAQDDEEEEVYQLSPFTVDAGDEDGYMTKSTTAGTRLRTDVKDLGAQIDILSKEFLDDIAATSPEEAFFYSLNIENEEENPDYGDGSRARFERTGPASTARGLGNSRTTGTTRGRNFFETKVRTHTYNLESIAISSGPNSILFGLGQAGGTVNSALSRAQVNKDKGSFTLRGDNHGSFEWFVDLNKVIIQDKLAIRIALLNKQKDSFQDGSYDDQERLYGAITYKVNDKLNFRLHYEDIVEQEAPEQFRMFQDKVSPWLLDAGAPPYIDAATNKNAQLTDYWDQASGRRTLLVAPNGELDLDTVGVISWRNQYDAQSRSLQNYVQRVSEKGITDSMFYDEGYLRLLDNKAVTFSPETLEAIGVPFDEINPWGDTMRRTRKGDILTAFAEANPFENFFVEVGYNDENINGRQFGYNRSFNYSVLVDAQQSLPNGEPNPHYGELYVQDELWGWETPQSEKEFRVMASYELDFNEKELFGDRWSSLLGRHNFGALYSDRESMQIRANSFGYYKQNDDGSSPSFLPGAALPDPNNLRKAWQSNGNRRVSYRQYLLPENGYMLQAIPGFEPGRELGTFPDPAGNGNVQIAHFDPEVGSHRLFSFDRAIESEMFTYQGFLWDNRIVLTYGRRVDDVSTAELAGAGDRAQNYTHQEWLDGDVPDHVLPGGNFPWWTDLDWAPHEFTGKNTNSSKGIVLHAPVPGNWLSFFYNEGSNNDAGTIRRDAFGGFNAAITGVGEDYGVRFSLLQNKLTFKINKYKTDSQNVQAQNDGGIRGTLNNLEERLYEANKAEYQTNGFDIFGQTDLFLPVMDKSSEGTEFTLSARPTSGWNVRFTAAKTEAVSTNIATSYFKWGDERSALWQSMKWYEDDLAGVQQPVIDWWNEEDPRNLVEELIDPEDPESGFKSVYQMRVEAGFTRIDPTTGELEMEDVTIDGVNTQRVKAYNTKIGTVGVDTPISGWDNVAFRDNSANPETVEEYYEREYIVDSKSRAQQLDGIANPNVREWRMNFTTSYQFQEGPLKGWRVGGSARYRDAGVVGYGRTQLVDENTGQTFDILDISNPFYSDEEIFIDGMVSYRGKLGDGKRYRVQLNVRNLFDNSDLYPTQVTTTGRETVWATFSPRTYMLTTSVDF